MQLQDSVSIFNMFRGTARQLYDAGLVIEVSRGVFFFIALLLLLLYIALLLLYCPSRPFQSVI